MKVVGYLETFMNTTLLNTDGTAMTMEEVADLLTFAALGGVKPTEVSESAWLAVCERVWKDAENELGRAYERLKRTKQEMIDAVASAHFKMKQYIEAKNNMLGIR